LRKFGIPYPATAVIAIGFIACMGLFAQPRGHEGPPPEIQACKDKSAGDKCSFKSRDGSAKSDVCKTVRTPMGEELACGDMPAPPDRGSSRGRPGTDSD
jgi:hypothetical protein